MCGKVARKLLTYFKKILPIAFLSAIVFLLACTKDNPSVPGDSPSDNTLTRISKGYGYSERENSTPFTDQTSFPIGSNTKAFTAMALCQAQELGALNLDAPVRSYLPSMQFSDTAVTAGVTLRDILSHRTGLPRHDRSGIATSVSIETSCCPNFPILKWTRGRDIHSETALCTTISCTPSARSSLNSRQVKAGRLSCSPMFSTPLA